MIFKPFADSNSSKTTNDLAPPPNSIFPKKLRLIPEISLMKKKTLAKNMLAFWQTMKKRKKKLSTGRINPSFRTDFFS